MYSQIFNLQAKFLKAIANPRRLEIIHLLRNQELAVSQIQAMLGLPQANLSQHLQVLRNTKVLKTRRKGKQIYYSISDKNFVKASDLIRTSLIKEYKNTPLADEFTLKMSDLVPVVHDPVCKMRVSPKTAAAAFKYKNQQYYFCASGCYKKFMSKPSKYL